MVTICNGDGDGDGGGGGWASLIGKCWGYYFLGYKKRIQAKVAPTANTKPATPNMASSRNSTLNTSHKAWRARAKSSAGSMLMVVKKMGLPWLVTALPRLIRDSCGRVRGGARRDHYCHLTVNLE
jgi:hypothetical protein